MQGRLAYVWSIVAIAMVAAGWLAAAPALSFAGDTGWGQRDKVEQVALWLTTWGAALLALVWLMRASIERREWQAVVLFALVWAALNFSRGYHTRQREDAAREALTQALSESQADAVNLAFASSSALLRLTVVDASLPGETCRFAADLEDTPWRVVIDTQASPCVFAQGEAIWLIRSTLRQALAQWPSQWNDDPSQRAVLGRFAAQGRLWLDNVVRAPGEARWYWQAIAKLRWRAYVLAQGRPALGFVVASSLGLATALDRETTERLRVAGLNHLVAVSGQQVGLAAAMFCGLAMRLLLVVGQRPRVAIVMASLAMWTYVALSGAAPSAWRAGMMTQIFYTGRWLGKSAHGPATLTIAAAMMVVCTPAMVQDLGFQLSVVAMFALFALPHDAGVIEQTWRMSWALAPISLWNFGSASLAGIAANIVAVPVFALWVLPLGIFGCLSEAYWGKGMLAPALWGSHLIVLVGDLVSRVGEAQASHWLVLCAVVCAGRLALSIVARRTAASGRWIFWWARALPNPFLPILVAIAAWGGSTRSVTSRPADRHAPHWVALGTSHAYACLAAQPLRASAQAAGQGAPEAWIFGLQGSPMSWPGIVRKTGFSAVLGVKAAPDDERTARLVGELRRAQLWRGDENGAGYLPTPCPQRSVIRERMHACQQRSGAMRVAVRHRDQADDCWVADRWQPLDLLSDSVNVKAK